MLVYFDAKRDTITTYKDFASIKKEVLIRYGVNGIMTLTQFYRIAEFTPIVSKLVDDYIEGILLLPNTLLTGQKGDSYKRCWVNKKTGSTINNVGNYRPSGEFANNYRLYQLGIFEAEINDIILGKDVCRISISYSMYATDVDYNQAFIQKLNRACIIDNILNDL